MTIDHTTASSLTEDQAIGVAKLAVKQQAPGWQAFEVLLRMLLRMADELDRRRRRSDAAKRGHLTNGGK